MPEPEPGSELWQWRQVGPRLGGGHRVFPDVDDGFYLDDSTRPPAVMDRRKAEQLLTLTAPPKRELGKAQIEAPWLVWTAQSQGLPLLYDGFVENLQTGGGYPIAPPVAPAMSEPGDLKVSGGLVGYASKNDHGRYCLAILDLAARDGRLVRCGQTRVDVFLEAELSSHGFAAIAATPRGGPTGCRTPVFTTDPTAERPQWDEIDLRRKCWAMTAVVGDGFVAWDEQDPQAEYKEVARLYARTETGEKVELGQDMAATLEPCGEWLYWKANPVGDVEVVRRWKPGTGVEVVYRGSPRYASTDPVCHGDQMTLLETWVGSGQLYDRLMEANIA
ncbi:MAG: hypothetical protein ACRDO7_03805 [Nocardioidaceae bacterium]